MKESVRCTPHGGKLVNLIADQDRIGELHRISKELDGIVLSDRQLSDLELLSSGAYSPLTGFLRQKDFESVLSEMRLEDGTLWPLPVCLDVDEKTALKLKPEGIVALRDAEGFMPAVLHVEDVWPVNAADYVEAVYGTGDPEHPGVNRMIEKQGKYFAGGWVEALTLPLRFGFRRLRHTPLEIRALFKKMGWRRVVGFHTENIFHKKEFKQALAALEKARANLLLHPVVGRIRPGDMMTYTRIRCYQAACGHFPPSSMTALSLLPYSMQYAGPKETVLHAIIRKNYGCTHFMVSPNHAGPDNAGKNKDYYNEWSSLEMAQSVSNELDMSILPCDDHAYSPEEGDFIPVDDDSSTQTLSISERDYIKRLETGKKTPEWFTFPEIHREMALAFPPKSRQGFTVFCTGLSGAGKSTIAKLLCARLQEVGDRPVTLLDGDIVRHNLSNELGFSREHRDINVRRIGFVANEITKNKGAAICAPIAPYASARRHIRNEIEKNGGFIEVYVSTPLSECESRDPKGLYARARAGLIKGLTGVDDPYEKPEKPEIVLNTVNMTPEEAAQEVLLHLERSGYIR